MTELTQERLKELLYYNPDTGLFTWRVDRRRCRADGGAGSINNGYVYIGVDGKKYYAHRLAFLYIDGAFPPGIVDHINRDRVDNRFNNLRYADHTLNGANRHDNNKFVGVCWNRRDNRWAARVKVNNHLKPLGTFVTHLAACYARHAYDKTIEQPNENK